MWKQSGVRIGAMGLKLPENVANNILNWTSRPPCVEYSNLKTNKQTKKEWIHIWRICLPDNQVQWSSFQAAPRNMLSSLSKCSLVRRMHVPIATWLWWPCAVCIAGSTCAESGLSLALSHRTASFPIKSSSTL